MTLYLSSQTVVTLAFVSSFFAVACGGSTETDLDTTPGTGGGVATGGGGFEASGGGAAEGGSEASGGAAIGGSEATGGAATGGSGASDATGGADAGRACVPNGNSGLEGERLALGLSDEEVTTMCEAIVVEPTAAKAQCAITGALFASIFSTNDSGFQASCLSFEKECFLALNELDCAEPEPFSTDCEATVCDYEVCMAQTIEGAKIVNCEGSLAEVTAYIAANMAQTPECDRVNACGEE